MKRGVSRFSKKGLYQAWFIHKPLTARTLGSANDPSLKKMRLGRQAKTAHDIDCSPVVIASSG